MTKTKIAADLWHKDIAPSTNLRKWFGHDRSKWQDFKDRYWSELDHNPETVQTLLDLALGKRLTLLFSAKDTECNQAMALREYLISRLNEQR